jgi:hypothetical protein
MWLMLPDWLSGWADNRLASAINLNVSCKGTSSPSSSTQHIKACDARRSAALLAQVYMEHSGVL